ncbi:hypothetical protein ANN_03895 [Periplaneta americana]|uniref:Receptor ligand binding region domain-containing protein n=1 Tax=Periplaneta americana TaxID=6978 RepID=A0ABQ8U2G6_PERAM|nr:hypothetical protein ANN_03895 [Periplaneta americana]
MAGLCEGGNEPPGSLKANKYLTVLFHPEDYPLQHIAVKYALQHINVDPELLPGTELYRVDLNVSQSDSFAVGKRVCGLASEGIAAVFGPRTPDTTGIVESICETLEIPHMEIYPTSPRFPARCLINLHPAEESISKAIVDVVTNFLHWRTFTVLYETEAGLIRLQDVLKAHGPNDPPITVRQFLPGSDQRQLLKDINASKQYHILLECEADHVIEVLRQAREIGMMGDYHSYFITSLCAVSSTQKFLVQQHITTSKHQANKQLNSKQRQLFLTQPTTSNVRSEFNIDLCRSLISADIPLYKLKNKVFREFLEKYTQHTIPDESTLRKTYAPSIYDETIQKIRDEIKDSSIWVSIDETPDKEGRLVGNVVIGLLSEQYSERILLHCDVLEKCNNKTIVKLFNEAMGILWPKGIMYDNVLFFISDAALIWSKLDKHYLLYILN